MHIRIHPSILAADFANLEAAVGDVEAADAVHVDVMDNHFVPTLTFGPQMVQRLSEVSPVPLDVHLMIANADDHAAHYAELGADSVTFHVEAATDPKAVIDSIQSHGARAGIAIKPGTPLEPYLPLVHSADLVLIMTVEPGAGGQSFMPEMMPKLLALHRYLGEQGLSPLVQVDGGITVETLPIALTHGADTFVAGSSVYGHGIPGDNIRALREAATKGEA